MQNFCEWCKNNNEKLIEEWDYERNILLPQEYAPASNKKVWWRCNKGHNFECSVYHRTYRNQGCPYCSGKKILTGYNDLKTRNPQLASEWNYSRNTNITPDKISLNSHNKVWWICSNCKYEWQATPNDRNRGRNCPICAKKTRKETRTKTLISTRTDSLLTNYPDLIREWNFEKNTGNPEEFLSGSKSKVWWRCSICGNEWNAVIKNRVNGSGCPKCMKHMRTSFPEQAIFYYLKKHYSTVINSYTESFENKMEIDVFIQDNNTGIEYDGVAFHSGEKAVNEMIKKYKLCKEKNIRLIRISEFENHYSCYDLCLVRKGHTDEDLNAVLQELLVKLNINNISVDVVRDRSQIMQQYITSIQEKSISFKFPEIAKKWDITKNGGLKPEQVSAFSNTKYWWKCSLGHSYQATPYNEIFYTKTCPICSNHRVLSGFNDLVTKSPELAKEWDVHKNLPSKPSEVLFTTSNKYWWICPKGHSYKAGVNNRYYNNTGCPYCSNQKVLVGYNDLKTVCPDLLNEWNYKRNLDVKPNNILPGSNKKVWWICRQGHEWSATVNSRSGKNKAGCPYCTNKKVLSGYNDLATKNTELLDEWDYDKNINTDPSIVAPGSNQKVWWKCKTCGNEWQSRIVSRTMNNAGCPICGYKVKMRKNVSERIKREKKDLCTLFPELIKEWDFNKNNYNPSEVSPGANIKVWWKCNKGHSYQSWLSDRTGKRKTGCPYCHGKRKL